MTQDHRNHSAAEAGDSQHYRPPMYHRPIRPEPVQNCPPIRKPDQPWYGSDAHDYPRSPVRDSELIYRSPESEQKKAELRRAPKPEKKTGAPKQPLIPADGLIYTGPVSREPAPPVRPQPPKAAKPRIPADGLLYQAPAVSPEPPPVQPPREPMQNRQPAAPREPQQNRQPAASREPKQNRQPAAPREAVQHRRPASSAEPTRQRGTPVRREPEPRRKAPSERPQQPPVRRRPPEPPVRRPEKQRRMPPPPRPEPAEASGLWKKILGAAAVVLLILGMVAAIAAGQLLDRFGKFEDATLPVLVTPEVAPPPEVGEETVPSFTEAQELSIEDSVNIMLIGADASPDGVRSRSDTMILVTLNPRRNAIQMTSFMRDTYVHIPGYQDNRLNAAYRFGGVELMNDTIRKNFGVTVDGNVMVDFSKFAQIIDLLGGVDVELNREETNYMIKEGCMMEPGLNHMTGEQALTFVRMRYVSGGDYGRTERQRRVLTQLMGTFRDADLGTVINLVEQILPSITTNISKMDIIKYVTNGMILLSQGASIETLQIPANDAHRADTISGMSVLVPDLEMCREDLVEFFAPRAAAPVQPTVQPTDQTGE